MIVSVSQNHCDLKADSMLTSVLTFSFTSKGKFWNVKIGQPQSCHSDSTMCAYSRAVDLQLG